MANPTNSNNIQNFVKTFTQLGKAPNQGITSLDMARVGQRQQDLSKFLGQTDYSKQLQEAQDLGKLQLALALAQQGFAAAGATPKRGEAPISTISRELFSPLAGTAGAVATQMMQQRRAIENARAQEDRQLKLSALQQIQQEDALNKNLALKLMTDPTKSGLKQGNRGFARKRNKEGKPTGPVVPLQYTYDPSKNEYQARVIGEGIQDAVTLGGPNPTHIVTNEKGEVLGGPTDGDGTYKDNLVVVSTKTNKPLLDNDKKFIQVSRRGNRLFRLGSQDVYTQPKETKLVPFSQLDKASAATPKGLDDPKFEAQFSGIMADMGKLQTDLNLGRTGLRFDPVKYNLNKKLEPGPNFPFNKVVGVNQDGSLALADLSKEEQKIYANNIRSSFFNLTNRIKTGDQPADLSRTFVEEELSKSLSDLGFAVPTRPSGVSVGRAQIRDPRQITQSYKDADFSGNAEEVIRSLPIARTTQNIKTGIGKLVVAGELGVGFGESTKAPAALSAQPTPVDIVNRANLVRGKDKPSIQERILAENLAKSTSLNSKLNVSVADTIGKQTNVFGSALAEKQKTLSDALNDIKGKEIAETVGKSLEAIANLDRLDALAKRSGAVGFISGPIKALEERTVGTSFTEFFKSNAEKRAALELRASMPILRQLFTRDLLKGVGEQRISNSDLKAHKPLYYH